MNKTIPKKNYVILGLVIIGTFFFMYYIYMWYDAYLDTKTSKPILDRYMEVINFNELDDYLIENNDAIIYVSVLEDSEIRSFEKKLKALFKSHSIDKDILYMDVTNNKMVVDTVLSKYSNGTISNGDVPMILVIEGGVLRNVYNIKSNNYDIELVKLFINGIKFLGEDELYG